MLRTSPSIPLDVPRAEAPQKPTRRAPALGWRVGLLGAGLALLSNILLILVGWLWTLGEAPIESSTVFEEHVGIVPAGYSCVAHSAFAKQVYRISVKVNYSARQVSLYKGTMREERIPMWVRRAVHLEHKRTMRGTRGAGTMWVCGNGWPLVCVRGVASDRRESIDRVGLVAWPEPAGQETEAPRFGLAWKPEPRGMIVNLSVHWVLWMVGALLLINWRAIRGDPGLSDRRASEKEGIRTDTGAHG